MIVQVEGMDVTREAYRVRIEAEGKPVLGLVPEALVRDALGLARRPEHGEVYQWLARHSSQIESALIGASRGAKPARPPFDAVMLAQET